MLKILFISFAIAFLFLSLIVGTCTTVDVLVILTVLCFGFYAVLDKLDNRK